ncbi:TPA: hypothetical protein ACX6NR_002758 [Photobacterium damselae]
MSIILSMCSRLRFCSNNRFNYQYLGFCTNRYHNDLASFSLIKRIGTVLLLTVALVSTSYAANISDSDHNGIEDTVDAYIKDNSITLNEQKAAQELVYALYQEQLVMLKDFDIAAMVTAHKHSEDALACFGDAYGNHVNLGFKVLINLERTIITNRVSYENRVIFDDVISHKSKRYIGHCRSAITPKII